MKWWRVHTLENYSVNKGSLTPSQGQLVINSLKLNHLPEGQCKNPFYNQNRIRQASQYSLTSKAHIIWLLAFLLLLLWLNSASSLVKLPLLKGACKKLFSYIISSFQNGIWSPEKYHFNTKNPSSNSITLGFCHMCEKNA